MKKQFTTQRTASVKIRPLSSVISVASCQHSGYLRFVVLASPRLSPFALRFDSELCSSPLIPFRHSSSFCHLIIFTVVPEKLRKWAGTFCVLLPHGRDE